MNAITYKHFTGAHIEDLNDARGCTEKVRKILRGILCKEEDSGKRKEAIENFQFYNFAFAKDMDFNTKKTACYMSIMQEVLLHDIDQGMGSVESSMKHFKKLVLRHATERPPVSVGIFSSQDVSSLVKDTSSRYYRHFSMYKNIFVKRKDDVVIVKDSKVV